MTTLQSQGLQCYYKCSQCDARFSSLQALGGHKSAHSNKRKAHPGQTGVPNAKRSDGMPVPSGFAQLHSQGIFGAPSGRGSTLLEPVPPLGLLASAWGPSPPHDVGSSGMHARGELLATAFAGPSVPLLNSAPLLNSECLSGIKYLGTEVPDSRALFPHLSPVDPMARAYPALPSLSVQPTPPLPLPPSCSSFRRPTHMAPAPSYSLSPPISRASSAESGTSCTDTPSRLWQNAMVFPRRRLLPARQASAAVGQPNHVPTAGLGIRREGVPREHLIEDSISPPLATASSSLLRLHAKDDGFQRGRTRYATALALHRATPSPPRKWGVSAALAPPAAAAVTALIPQRTRAAAALTTPPASEAEPVVAPATAAVELWGGNVALPVLAKAPPPWLSDSPDWTRVLGNRANRTKCATGSPACTPPLPHAGMSLARSGTTAATSLAHGSCPGIIPGASSGTSASMRGRAAVLGTFSGSQGKSTGAVVARTATVAEESFETQEESNSQAIQKASFPHALGGGGNVLQRQNSATAVATGNAEFMRSTWRPWKEDEAHFCFNLIARVGQEEAEEEGSSELGTKLRLAQTQDLGCAGNAMGGVRLVEVEPAWPEKPNLDLDLTLRLGL